MITRGPSPQWPIPAASGGCYPAAPRPGSLRRVSPRDAPLATNDCKVIGLDRDHLEFWRANDLLHEIVGAADVGVHPLDVRADAPRSILGEPQVRELPASRPVELKEDFEGSAIDEVGVPEQPDRDLLGDEPQSLPSIPHHEPAPRRVGEEIEQDPGLLFWERPCDRGCVLRPGPVRPLRDVTPRRYRDP